MKPKLTAAILLSLFAGIAVADPPKSEAPSPEEVEDAVLKYIGRGMPSTERKWAGTDLSTAAKVLR